MSGETEKDVNGWTTDTLHAHLSTQIHLLRTVHQEHVRLTERQIDLALATQQQSTHAALNAADKAVAAALASIQESTRVQTAMLTERADKQNEWRATVSDILARAMPRTEAEQQIAHIMVALQSVPSRAEMDAVNTLLTDRIADLTNWRNQVEGQGLGAKESRAGIYAAIAAVPVIIAIVMVIVDLASGG